jgi:ABC-2 type transport system ATP-binding protein
MMSPGTDQAVPALDIIDLTAGYGRRVVLDNVTFSVGQGQTYGLIGLNGVGKTTLIKTVLSLKDSISGDIRIFGHKRGSDEARQKISYLPERFDPPWFLKGGEFINFSVSLYGRSVSHDSIEQACRQLALDPAVLKNKVQTYSKGMRQKLGLIATVLTGCDMLILDEPMSGLDPLARSLVKGLLQSVRQEGRTVIFSSHILSDMDEICDKVSVTHGGSIPFTGTPQALREQMGNESLEKAFLKLIGEAA